MTEPNNANFKKGQKILSGPKRRASKEELVEMLGLADSLVAEKNFSLARQVLKRARFDLLKDNNPEFYEEIFQKSALYTYKDPDLPRDWKLNEALEILQEAFDLTETESQETLGLAGAIFKRKWDSGLLLQNLELSLFYYLRGYSMGIRAEDINAPSKSVLQEKRAAVLSFLRDNPDCRLWADKDRGYCGINAAFVLDLLAYEQTEEANRAGLSLKMASGIREDANLIRLEITRSVPALSVERNWWFFATVGEAHFGLANYSEAINWLVQEPARIGLNVREWEYETTARQLARLARLQCKPGITDQEFGETEPGKALKQFLKGDEEAVLSAFRGKFGLGLSGGGFRASLFHIGVLAKLAELNVLRHIEVLSCVSGGSIIGTHYYLELRKLLATKCDDDIGRDDYIEIVKRVQRDFLAGVQRNIRTRVLGEWLTNLKMVFLPGYTRTLRVGELYERELFSFIEDIKGPKGEFRSAVTGPKWLPDPFARWFGWKREPRWLDELYIYPRLPDGSNQTDFTPRNHNWRRRNKAPDLILNAATLNTGHNWQFTASFMGEPPAPIVADIDANYRLRRMYYKDAPPKYRKFRLGHAVAASSCVPGLFEPLILNGLYPDDPQGKLNAKSLISVQLIDGGACDNQGIASLLEQDCSVILVSDASGQMEAQNKPAGGPLGVLLRTTDLVQARVREAQYIDVSSRRRSSQLVGLLFIHLRQDLPGGSIAWRDCPSMLTKSEFEGEQNGTADITSFGVSSNLQRKLAAIRTDLDSFNDAEAYALMASGYLMTDKQFGRTGGMKGFAFSTKSEHWSFLNIEESLKPDAKSYRHLERLLNAGNKLTFKIWTLSPVLIATKWILLAASVATVVWFFYEMRNASVVPQETSTWLGHITYGRVAGFLIGTAVFAIVASAVNVIVGRKSGEKIMRVIRWRDTIRTIAVGIAMSTVGFLIARLHLHIFDRLYISYGKLDRFPK